MTRLWFSLFIVAHGLVHAAIWLSPKLEKAPFDPRHSWLLSRLGLQPDFIRVFAALLAAAAALTLVLGGIGLLTHQGWWLTPLYIGALTSLFLILVYFHPWLSFGLALDWGVLYLVVIRHWPSV
ncbi:MAG: hypothetical protein PHI34_13830 [Acidobacteriota bacterium]|nr:hypothetical protein [Acidobacteriota bacterium]